MDKVKRNFVRNGFYEFTQSLAADATGNWGKMNAQQMVEHVTAFFKLSSGKIVMPVLSSEEQLVKLKAFLLSDKEFRENTKAPKEIIGDDPLPLRNETMEAALTKLKLSIEEFFQFFSVGPDSTSAHPVFGVLSFDEWVLLHYKHVLHHAKQFGFVPKV
jgi:Protein of unknown function (DUF1569)